MMNNTLKSQFNFQSGTVIVGKWHKKKYTIVKELGFGANGMVYLAQNIDGYVALKMSDNNMSITSEVNVLKAFSKVQGSPLGPKLLDVDDWELRGKNIPFYVMEYIQGPDLLTFVKDRGISWTGILMAQLLSDLERIHTEGWVFGDLKPENLIVTGPPFRIRCIDVGGTTIKGRAIKEFTEFFDRGYWLGASRRAEESYDLFSVAMIFMNLSYPKRFKKQDTAGMSQLRQAIHTKPELKKYSSTILAAIEGKFHSATDMREDLLQSLSRSNQKQQSGKKTVKQPTPSPKPNQFVTQAANSPGVTNRHQLQKKKKVGHFAETVLVVIIVALLYALYIYGELL